jgi:hypothetical protein
MFCNHRDIFLVWISTVSCSDMLTKQDEMNVKAEEMALELINSS